MITGTGRCGTGFTATVLADAGLAVGHEEWFTLTTGARRDDLVGDVSWIAVPELDRFDGIVVQQVRHPLDVIRSLVGIRMFTDAVHGWYRLLMFDEVPGLGRGDLADAVRWWVEWNERIEEHASMRVLLRDMDAACFERLTAHVGHPVDAATCRRIVGEVGSDVNARPRATGLTWDDLPDGPDTNRLLETAARYGYQVA